MRGARARLAACLLAAAVLAQACDAVNPFFDRDEKVACRQHNLNLVLTVDTKTDGDVPGKIRGTGEPFGPCHLAPSSMDIEELEINAIAFGLKRRLPPPEERFKYMTPNQAKRLMMRRDDYEGDPYGVPPPSLAFDGFHPISKTAAGLNVSMNADYMFGNFTKRLMQDKSPIPCGFLGDPKSENNIVFDRDLREFDKCRLVVVTVIYNNYDDLKYSFPSMLKQMMCYIAFVDDQTKVNVSSLPDWDAETKMYQGWNVVTVVKHPYVSPLKSNRVIKLLVPRLFPYARYSIYTDSSRQLRVDPAKLLYHLLIKHGASFSVPTHYSRQNQYDEFKALVRLKGNVFDSSVLAEQQTAYSLLGFPLDYNTGLLTGCLILRDHLSKPANLASCAWFNEVMTYEPRDQVSFEYVMHALGYRSCPSHDEFERVRKTANKYAKRHMAFDSINTKLNSKLYKFEYCQLALVTNAYHHISRGAAWRNATFFRSMLDLPAGA